jgi:hypothetical protein
MFLAAAGGRLARLQRERAEARAGPPPETVAE